MSEKTKSRRRKTRRRTDELQTDFARSRAFGAIADFFARLHRKPFTVSQAVSIARALKPFAEEEARRRQAHGGTAPGRARDRAQSAAGFSSRDFIARCAGLAPATLRKAEAVIDAAQLDPGLGCYVEFMDSTGKVGEMFARVKTGDRRAVSFKPALSPPADRKFGERFIKDLIAAAFGGAKRFGTRAKISNSVAARGQGARHV